MRRNTISAFLALSSHTVRVIKSSSVKREGEESFANKQEFFTQRGTLKRKLCTFDFGSICSTD